MKFIALEITTAHAFITIIIASLLFTIIIASLLLLVNQREYFRGNPRESPRDPPNPHPISHVLNGGGSPGEALRGA